MISRVLAPNPGLYTGPGTNTYVIESEGEAVVVDPGPVIAAHAAEIIRCLGDAVPVAVFATHTHPDHAPLANPLARQLEVPVYGYEEGPHFLPDITIDDGETVSFGSAGLDVVHTPGHTSDHLCFRLGDVLFTGDHIMGGSTVVIEDAAAYLQSLYLVRDLGVRHLEPGHGDSIDDAAAAINDYIDHRLERERQIVEAIAMGVTSIGDIVDLVYAGIPADLRHAAVHQVGVQIIKLGQDGVVTLDGRLPQEETEVRLVE